VRKYHRWLSIVFGVFLLWIAATGVMSQLAALKANGGFENETAERGQRQAAALGGAIVPAASAHGDDEEAPRPVAVAAGAAAPFVCPADMICRPKPAPDGARAWVGYLHHLHSGEEFGPAGVVISILSGLALLFFAFSGLWMYLRMWGERRGRSQKPVWFWR
jgi:hypothetical protein